MIKYIRFFIAEATVKFFKFIYALIDFFSGHRFRTTYDFGFASLDVLTVYGEDSGEYTCKATNRLGQAKSSVKLNVKCK